MSAQSIPARLEADVSVPNQFVLGYRPALDGLRGVAILAVLAVHTSHLFGWSILKGGNIGVDIFFVLSGFLITSILLNEWNQTGDVSLKNFYLRRCLRLVPALLLMVLIVYPASSLLFSAEEAAHTRSATPWALMYVTDFVIAFFPNIGLGALRHTWSLAMEEQFYLLWPPLLIILLKTGASKKQLVLLTVSLAVLSALHRAALYQSGASLARTYYGIDVRADALLIGCAAGMAVTWGLIGSMSRVTKPAVLLLALLLVVSDYATPFMHRGGFTVLAFATGLIVINLVTGETGISRRILESPPLVWTGRISYGVYLWHYPIFKALKYLSAPAPVKLVLALLVTFGASALSFYLMEDPLLRLKRRFSGKLSAQAT
jgi:peptidoglycan/LPS O-acetylase OafA/YrhL